MPVSKPWSEISLRISSGTVTPADMSRLLGVQPSQTFLKGTPVSPRHPSGMRRDENLWIFKYTDDPTQPLDKQLHTFLDFLESRRDVLAALSKDAQMDLFCGFSAASGQAGGYLSHTLLCRLAALPIDLVLDLYPPQDESGAGLDME